MKKSLLAIAALSTIAGAAQAQSSVTLFGALDEAGYYANQVNKSSSSQAWGMWGNSVATSNWGLKGTEDLGGGTKANFYAESGLNPSFGSITNTGVPAASGANGTGLFDRGLSVGVAGNWGALDLGNKKTPFISATADLLPVGGNSAAVNAAVAGGYSFFFAHNSITYTMPTIAGFNAGLQYGTGNVVNSSNGSQINGAVTYDVAGLRLTGAYQYLARGGSVISSNYMGTSVSTTYAANQSPAIQTYTLGAKYKTGPFSIGGGWVSNNVNYTGVVNTSAAPLPNYGGTKYLLNQFQLGLGYQATPAVLLGLNWIGNTSGSSLLNAQARYAFSKRTQAYAQVGYGINSATGLNGSGLGNFTAIYGASGNVAPGTTGSPLALPTFNQAAFGVGLIHTF